MKSFIIFPLVLLFIAACDAHTRVSNVTINGRTTNECLRPGSSSNPIMSSDGDRNGLMEANYTCGFLPNAARAATASCSIAAGSEMNISYYHGANYGDETPEKDYWIASSHRGPFLAYMARWENSSGIPSGLALFKIFHSGITKNATGDYKTIQWASPDTLNSNNGAMTVRIPAQLAPGRYLLRTEIIALHDNRERGAQPYVRCIDLTVTGSGRSVPKDLVALPGAIGYNDTGLRFSVYQTRNQNYPIPGPSVFDFSRSPSIPSGNGTIVDISCAGFPDGACPSPSTCNLATGRCQCPTGTRMQGFQCTGATSATKASTNAASSTVRSTNAATSSTKGSSNAASSSTRPTNSTARSSDAASSSTRGSTTAISSNKGSTNFTGSSNNQGSVSSEIEEVTSDASMFVISGMLTIISLFL